MFIYKKLVQNDCNDEVKKRVGLNGITTKHVHIMFKTMQR